MRLLTQIHYLLTPQIHVFIYMRVRVIKIGVIAQLLYLHNY